MFTFPLIFAVINYKLIALASAPLAVGAVSYLMVRGDSRVEDRRKNAVKMAELASENGFPLLSELLACYAVGDYSGCIAAVKALHGTLTDDVLRKAAWDNVLKVQLAKRLGSKETRAQSIAYVANEFNLTIVDKNLPPSSAA